MLFAIILVAAGLLIGLTLIAMGLRGRRINDHPICRGCGFDLIGVVPAISVCPECGRDATGSGAIRHGQRRRRPGLIVLGFAIVALSAGSSLIRTSSIAPAVAMVLPGSWLLHLGELLPPAWSGAFSSEYMDRFALGTLDSSAIAAGARASIRSLARDRSAWEARTGDLVVQAFEKGVISDKEAAEFLALLRVPRLAVAPQLEPGVLSWTVWLDLDPSWEPAFGTRLSRIPIMMEAIEAKVITRQGTELPVTLRPPGDFIQAHYFSASDRSVPAGRFGGGTSSIGLLQGTVTTPPQDATVSLSLKVRTIYDEALGPTHAPDGPDSSVTFTLMRPLPQPHPGQFSERWETTLIARDVQMTTVTDTGYESVTDPKIGEQLRQMLKTTIMVGPADPDTGERSVTTSGANFDGLPVAVIAQEELWSGDKRLGRGQVQPMVPMPRATGQRTAGYTIRWKIPAGIDPRTLRVRLEPADPIKHGRVYIEGALSQKQKLRIFRAAIEPDVEVRISE
jgi:hypothetical protein